MTAIDGEEDHDATWLLGHTDRIDFGPLFARDEELWCRARIHVPCRFLATGDDGGTARCTAHGYSGKLSSARRRRQGRRLGADRFRIVERQRLIERRLAAPKAAPRRLPVIDAPNPCATARCTTSDHTIGAACCRDVEVDIACDRSETLLEALIRNRKSPYLCKTERFSDEQLTVEILSACGFLKDDNGCDLHGRVRADGRPAKPLMCSRWPEKRTGLHPKCAFRNTRLKV